MVYDDCGFISACKQIFYRKFGWSSKRMKKCDII